MFRVEAFQKPIASQKGLWHFFPMKDLKTAAETYRKRHQQEKNDATEILGLVRLAIQNGCNLPEGDVGFMIEGADEINTAVLPTPFRIRFNENKVWEDKIVCRLRSGGKVNLVLFARISVGFSKGKAFLFLKDKKKVDFTPLPTNSLDAANEFASAVIDYWVESLEDSMDCCSPNNEIQGFGSFRDVP